MAGVIKFAGEIGDPILISLRSSQALGEYENPAIKAEQAAVVLIADAQRRAQAILSTVRQEIAELQELARREGYQDGIRQGSMRIQELIEQLETNILTARQDRAVLMESAEPDLLKLCFTAVEKIIRHEVKTDSRVVIRIIKSLLRRVKDGSEVHVRVSPEEVDKVRSCRDELLAECEIVPGITISDDRRLGPGSCIVESLSGDYDARIEIQMDKIYKRMSEIAADGGVSE